MIVCWRIGTLTLERVSTNQITGNILFTELFLVLIVLKMCPPDLGKLFDSVLHLFPIFSQTEDLRGAVSTLDSVLSGENNHGSDPESNLVKGFENP